MIKCIFENKTKAKLRHLVVDAVVISGHKILLVKREAHLSNGNKFALPGGFLERDETIKEAVLREFREETGYEGKIISPFRIIDNPKRKGEDRQNVAFVFLVKPTKKVSSYDKKEIKNIFWFDLESLPKEKDFAFDHYENIILYKDFIKKKFLLPVMSSS